MCAVWHNQAILVCFSSLPKKNTPSPPIALLSLDECISVLVIFENQRRKLPSLAFFSVVLHLSGTRISCVCLLSMYRLSMWLIFWWPWSVWCRAAFFSREDNFLCWCLSSLGWFCIPTIEDLFWFCVGFFFLTYVYLPEYAASLMLSALC